MLKQKKAQFGKFQLKFQIKKKLLLESGTVNCRLNFRRVGYMRGFL